MCGILGLVRFGVKLHSMWCVFEAEVSADMPHTHKKNISTGAWMNLVD